MPDETSTWRRHISAFGAENGGRLSAVEQIQSCLNSLGANPPLSVDGVLGPKTSEVLASFQIAHGLPATGTIDPQTLQALGLTGLGVSFGFDSAGLRQGVIAAFPAFTQNFEGRLNFMYLDNAGPPGPYVTTGVGNLIDPIGSATDLPWVHKSDGTPASMPEIQAEWNMVKGRTDLAPKGGGSFGSITTLKLTDATIDNLVKGKILQNEKILIARYPNLADWPADAQLGLVSMSWALGPAFNFPAFKAATDKLDFTTADKQSEYKGVGSAPRIAANHKLFQNAAMVIAQNLDRNTIWYPGTPGGWGGPGGGAIPDAEHAKLAAEIGLPLILAGAGLTFWMLSKSKFSKQLDAEVGA